MFKFKKGIAEDVVMRWIGWVLLTLVVVFIIFMHTTVLSGQNSARLQFLSTIETPEKTGYFDAQSVTLSFGNGSLWGTSERLSFVPDLSATIYRPVPLPTIEIIKKARVSFSFKKLVLPTALSFIAGGAWGTHEALMHHWPAVHKKYPGLNPQYWNPAVSWENKYWRNVPVQISDAKHLLYTVTAVSTFSAGITIAIGEKRPLWHYLAAAGSSLMGYSFGNFLTYNVLLK